jgi:parallel beta-helix repeat protein
MGTVSKSLALVIVALFLTSLIVVSIPLIKSQPVGNIVINSDGSVTGTNNIQQVGNTYALTSNIVNSQIEVQRDNVVIDGAGFTLTEPPINTTGIMIPAGGFPEINLSSRTNVTIKDLNIIGSISGITIQDSSNITIENNNLENCSNIALTSIDSNNTAISGNTITNNNQGIEILNSNYTTILANTLEQNAIGVWCYASHLPPKLQSGALSSCSYTDIIGNNIQANTKHGIDLTATFYTRIEYNNVENNANGIYLYPSYYTIIYQNNFITNTQSVFTDGGLSSGGGNTWIWNSTSQGNYWSDYLTKYPNATEVGNSGIGNSSYVIDANNIDYYPLMIEVQTSPPYSTIGFPVSSPSASISPSSPSPTPTVPEFSWLTILPLFVSMLFIAVKFRHRKTPKATK